MQVVQIWILKENFSRLPPRTQAEIKQTNKQKFSLFSPITGK